MSKPKDYTDPKLREEFAKQFLETEGAKELLQHMKDMGRDECDKEWLKNLYLEGFKNEL